MRLLGLDSEIDAHGEVHGWMPVTDAIRTADGSVRISAIAMLMDALGGLRSITAADPDWALTADLSIAMFAVPTTDVVGADLHVRRRGRRTLVIEVDLTDTVTSIGHGLLTFSVVPRPERMAEVRIESTPGRRSMSGLDPDQPPTLDYIAELGFTEHAPGHLSVDLRPEITNTVLALHGGVHTAMAEEATASLARHEMQAPAVVTDVHLAFMRLAHDGPITATAIPIGRAHDGRLTARVELTDANGELCSMATTTAVAP